MQTYPKILSFILCLFFLMPCSVYADSPFPPLSHPLTNVFRIKDTPFGMMYEWLYSLRFHLFINDPVYIKWKITNKKSHKVVKEESRLCLLESNNHIPFFIKSPSSATYQVEIEIQKYTYIKKLQETHINANQEYLILKDESEIPSHFKKIIQPQGEKIVIIRKLKIICDQNSSNEQLGKTEVFFGKQKLQYIKGIIEDDILKRGSLRQYELRSLNLYVEDEDSVNRRPRRPRRPPSFFYPNPTPPRTLD